MSRPRILVSEPIPRAWISALDDVGQVTVGLSEIEHAPNSVRALLSTLNLEVDAALLDRFENLVVVSNMAVGVDNIDLAACAERGILVGNTPGVLTHATADLAFALLLGVARRLNVAARDARDGRWGPWEPTGWLGADLHGKTLGIIGAGAIGCAVATRARGFGLSIVYVNRSPRPALERETGARRVELSVLLRESDFVSLHVPLTPETRHIIDTAALRAMKKDAFLINTARGAVVDQDALVRALAEGWIGGAALDVTTPEPLPPEHALFSEARAFIVPHIGSATHGTRRRMAELACENIAAALSGEPMPFEVGLERDSVPPG